MARAKWPSHFHHNLSRKYPPTRPGLESHAAGFVRRGGYTFRYDLGNRRLETAGSAPSRAARKWLVDTLPVHMRTVYDSEEHLAAIVRTVEGVPRAIVYTIVKD